jgi:hypothetical protein
MSFDCIEGHIGRFYPNYEIVRSAKSDFKINELPQLKISTMFPVFLHSSSSKVQSINKIHSIMMFALKFLVFFKLQLAVSLSA